MFRFSTCASINPRSFAKTVSLHENRCVEKSMAKKKTLTQNILTWGIPFIIITSYGLLSIQGDLRFSIPLLIGITAWIVTILSTALYFGEKKDVAWSPLVVMSVAIMVRIFFLFRTPELSDDIYRYLWDGLCMLQGNNPYTFAPLDVQPLDDMSFDLLKKINHPEIVTIYPPAAQMIFMTGVFFTKSVAGLKIMLCIVDTATCVLIIKILTEMELPVWRAILYAWHPIPVLEIASSGHIDGVGIFFLLCSILFLQSAQNGKNVPLQKEHGFIFMSGFLFGIASLVKLYPLFVIPVFLIVTPGVKRILFSLGVTVSIAIFTIPFMPDLYNIFNTLTIYLRNWEFSNFAFRTLRDITSSGDITRLFLVMSFLCVVTSLTIILWRKTLRNERDVISWKSFENNQVMKPVLSINVFNDFLKSIYMINFSFLLLTPTLYPWYVLGIVFLLPFIPGPAGIIFSWSVFLSYYILTDYVYLGRWVENSIIAALIWCGPALSFLITMYLKYRCRQDEEKYC